MSRSEVFGRVLGLLYALGMPLVFIAVEVAAALALTGWLSWALWAIAVWNVWVFLLRLEAIARLVKIEGVE